MAKSKTLDIAAIRAAAEKRGAPAPTEGYRKPQVVSATFTAKDGKVIVGVRVGSKFLAPEHIVAICEALGLTPDPERFGSLF